MEQADGFPERCGIRRPPAAPRRRSCPPFPSVDFTGIVRGVTPLSSACIRLHPDDDVAVAKAPLKAGTELADAGRVLTLSADVGRGHKLAVKAVADGAPLRKYGQIVGFAHGDIRPGDHVHLHNLAVRDFARDYEFGTDLRPVPPLAPGAERSFAAADVEDSPCSSGCPRRW